MEIMENVKKLVQEFIVPELGTINDHLVELKSTMEIMNKRMDDINTHLIDQSRRIDDLRTNLEDKIEQVRTNLEDKINQARIELKDEIFKNTNRIDNINMRLDNLYAVVVRREEHERLEQAVTQIKTQIQNKIAA